MQPSKTAGSNNNHRALQNHKRDLIVRKRAMEASRQLCNTEARPDEDSESREGEPAQEGLEQPALVEARVLHRPRPRALPQPERELGTARGEEREREDLEAQAGNHDVDAHLVLGLGRGAGRDAATGGLQDEREQVAAAEDKGVCARAEARQVLAVDDDDAREAEVDGGAEEGGRDGEADEVDEEVVAGWVEGVLVQQYAPGVADGFAGQAEEHGCHVAPCSVAHAQVDVGDEVDAEDGGVEGVAAQRGDVVEVGEGQVAEGAVAEGVVVFENGDVAVARVVVPVVAREAGGGDEEGFDAVEWEGDGAVGVDGEA